MSKLKDILKKVRGTNTSSAPSAPHVAQMQVQVQENIYEKPVTIPNKKNYRIVKNRIVFATNTFNYTCNPKYIYEALMSSGVDLDCYWMVLDINDAKKKYPDGTKLIQIGTDECEKIVYSARVWINNGIVFSNYFDKRPEQTYIQTMHGSLGIKKLDNAVGSRLARGGEDVKVVKRESENTDIVFTNSQFEEKVFRKAFWKKTPMERIGHARTDILFENENKIKINSIREKLLNECGVPLNKKIVLFAPTHRYKLKYEDIDIDHEALVRALSEKFGGEYCIAIRLHDRSIAVHDKVKKLVERGFSSKAAWTEIANIKETSWTDQNLESGLQYEYLVRACYEEDAEKYYAENADIVKSESGPGLPRITSVNVMADGVEIKWDSVEGADKYELFKSNRKENTKLIRTIGKLNSCIDKDIKTGIINYYSLRAVDKDGNVGDLDVEGIGATFYTPALEKPRHTASGTFLQWEEKPRATSYKVFRRPAAPIYDVTDYQDMQELMLVADVGISDYSSWMYDFVNTRKPGFLFVKDLDNYSERTGFAYPLRESPFAVCQDNKQLLKAVKEYNRDEHIATIDRFLADKQSVDDGESAKRAADRIIGIIKG